MSTDFGFTDLECKIITAQIERRSRFRCEFLKAKNDPFKHSSEAGYVVSIFDPAVQRFLSMKASQLDHFTFNAKTISFAIGAIVIPMGLYGYALWVQREQWLYKIRCGEIRPKDRLFKFK